MRQASKLSTVSTTATWRTLDKVMGPDSLPAHSLMAMAVRPEVVVVSTLQQLLQARGGQQQHKDCALSALEMVGATIRHAAAYEDLPREAWFDPRCWMKAVLLSAGPPPHYKQARPLYNAKPLQDLLLLLSEVGERDESSISFFGALLQVSFSSRL